MQAADLRVDEAFVTHLLVAVEQLLQGDAAPIEWDRLAVQVPDFRLVAFSLNDMVYVRELYVGPIQLGLSYTSCPWAAAEVKGETGARLHDWMGFINEVDAVSLSLGMLELADPYFSRDALMWLVIDHYKRQAISGFYSLLGAVPVRLGEGEGGKHHVHSFTRHAGAGRTSGDVSWCHHRCQGRLLPAGQRHCALARGLWRWPARRLFRAFQGHHWRPLQGSGQGHGHRQQVHRQAHARRRVSAAAPKGGQEASL